LCIQFHWRALEGWSSHLCSCSHIHAISDGEQHRCCGVTKEGQTESKHLVDASKSSLNACPPSPSLTSLDSSATSSLTLCLLAFLFSLWCQQQCPTGAKQRAVVGTVVLPTNPSANRLPILDVRAWQLRSQDSKGSQCLCCSKGSHHGVSPNNCCKLQCHVAQQPAVMCSWCFQDDSIWSGCNQCQCYRGETPQCDVGRLTLSN